MPRQSRWAGEVRPRSGLVSQNTEPEAPCSVSALEIILTSTMLHEF